MSPFEATTAAAIAVHGLPRDRSWSPTHAPNRRMLSQQASPSALARPRLGTASCQGSPVVPPVSMEESVRLTDSQLTRMCPGDSQGQGLIGPDLDEIDSNTTVRLGDVAVESVDKPLASLGAVSNMLEERQTQDSPLPSSFHISNFDLGEADADPQNPEGQPSVVAMSEETGGTNDEPQKRRFGTLDDNLSLMQAAANTQALYNTSKYLKRSHSDNSAEDGPARRHRRTAQFVWSPDQNPMPEAAQKELENVQAMTREMD